MRNWLCEITGKNFPGGSGYLTCIKAHTHMIHVEAYGALSRLGLIEYITVPFGHRVRGSRGRAILGITMWPCPNDVVTEAQRVMYAMRGSVPVCSTCGDYGVVPYEHFDPMTGNGEQGDQPCPDCQKRNQEHSDRRSRRGR